MTTVYNLDKNISGVNGFGLPFCDSIFSVTLTAATDCTVAVPLTSGIGLPSQTNNKWIAVMQYGNTVYGDRVSVAKNQTAVLPAAPTGGAFNASGSEIEPPAKYCQSGDVLHFICETESDVSVAFYALVES